MNHFLEWTAAVYIIAGLALSELLQREDPPAREFSLGLLALAAVFAAMSLRNFGVVGPNRKGCADDERQHRSWLSTESLLLGARTFALHC
jgi:hypothetical protein